MFYIVVNGVNDYLLVIIEYIYFLLNFFKYYIQYDWVFRLMMFNKWLKKFGRNVLRFDKIFEFKFLYLFIKYIYLNISNLFVQKWLILI